MSLQVEYAGCPLCAAHGDFLRSADCTPHALWNPELPATLDWMQCSGCGHVYTRHYWSPAGLRSVFSKAHESQVAGGDPDWKRVSWQPVVRNVTERLGESAVRPHGRVWVDAGCGDGALVMTAQEYGYRAIGLDGRARTVEAIRDLGYEALLGDFIDAPLPRPIDVLSLMDVLEHLPFPVAALERAHELLRPGGLLVVSLPDRESASWRIMDAKTGNPYWMEIEHHHNFAKSTLLRLLERCGFAPEDFNIAYRYKAQIEVYATRSPDGPR